MAPWSEERQQFQGQACGNKALAETRDGVCAYGNRNVHEYKGDRNYSDGKVKCRGKESDGKRSDLFGWASHKHRGRQSRKALKCVDSRARWLLIELDVLYCEFSFSPRQPVPD